MAFGGENAESYYDEGLTAFMKGDVDAAARFFVRAIQLDRSMLAAHHQLGKCYVRMGQPQRAVEILGQVVVQKPGLIAARLDLGQALLAQGLADDQALQRARKQFSHVLAIDPHNARAHLGMAQVCFQEGNWDGAVTLSQGARAHGGASFAVLFLLGRAAKLAGNAVLSGESLKEAQALIEKSVEMAPDAPEGHYLRGEVSFAQARFGSALEHYRSAQDRVEGKRHYSAFGESFTRLDILVKRGLCHQRLGDVEAAAAVGRQILSAHPQHKVGKALSDLANGKQEGTE